MVQPLLSVLVPTIHPRASLLQRMLLGLLPQCETFGSLVEVIVLADGGIHSGGASTGTKRNRLIEMSSGAFTAFVDDDDLVSSDYAAKVIGAIQTMPEADCVSLTGELKRCERSSHIPERFIHSIQYASWFTRDGVHYRCPNHLNAIARRHSLAVKFPNNNVEDYPWSMALRSRLKVQSPTDGVIYTYMARG